MCGLTGIVNLDFSKINQDILIEMTNQLAHRGPDGFGTEIVNNVGFGHRRLSILDLSRNGAPFLERSKIDKRRCPKPTLLTISVPKPSGPLWASWFVISIRIS